MVLSIAKIMDQLTDIKEVTLLYSPAQRSQEPLVRTEIIEDEPPAEADGCHPRLGPLSQQLGHVPEPLAPAPAPARKHFLRVGLVNSAGTWQIRKNRLRFPDVAAKR